MIAEKIMDRDSLRDLINRLKGEGRKIVFTNGCFDLLHAGHVRYLEEAKKLGDVLVIGLNSDRSVSRIKPGRPITAEQHRAEVLAALGVVDYVTLFDEDTPFDLISSIRPDILVKGGDWKPEEIVGRDIVSDVRVIPFVAGVSTSGIIRKIMSLSQEDDG